VMPASSTGAGVAQCWHGTRVVRVVTNLGQHRRSHVRSQKSRQKQGMGMYKGSNKEGGGGRLFKLQQWWKSGTSQSGEVCGHHSYTFLASELFAQSGDVFYKNTQKVSMCARRWDFLPRPPRVPSPDFVAYVTTVNGPYVRYVSVEPMTRRSITAGVLLSLTLLFDCTLALTTPACTSPRAMTAGTTCSMTGPCSGTFPLPDTDPCYDLAIQQNLCLTQDCGDGTGEDDGLAICMLCM